MKKSFLYILVLALLIAACVTSVQCQTQKYELTVSSELLLAKHRISAGFMGLREKTGNNDGYWIDRFNGSVGSPRYSSYCNAGPYFCWDSATRLYKFQYQIPVPKSGLANSTFDYAMKHGKSVPVVAKKYDYLIWRHSGKITGHVEVIDLVISGTCVRTQAFNTSFGKGTAENGNGCGYKTRYLHHPLGQMKLRGLVGFKAK